MSRVLLICVSIAGSFAALLLGGAVILGLGAVDPIGRVAALGVAVAWFGASAAGPSYYASTAAQSASQSRRVVVIVSLTQLFSIAVAVAALSRNLAVTWVSLEATTIIGAFLVASGKDRRQALEAAWKFAVLCFSGVGFGLVGIGLLAASARGVTVAPLDLVSLAAVSSRLDTKLLSLALASLFVAFGTKAALFPLHWWLPDAHSQGPTPVSALMSGGLVATSLAVIVKVLSSLHGLAIAGAFQHVLIGSGLLGLLVASFSMIDQRETKRLLAFSTVENVAVMAIAAGIGTPMAMAAFAIHLLGHAAVKTSAFLSAGALIATRGGGDVEDLAGAVGRQPWDSAGLLASAASLVAFPPSPLFASEVLLVFAAFQAHMVWLAIAVSALLAVAFVAMTQFAVSAVLGVGRKSKTGSERLSRTYTAASLAPIALALAITLARPQWALALVRGLAVASTGVSPW